MAKRRPEKKTALSPMPVPPARRWWSSATLHALIMVIACFLAYQPAWRGGILWDDDKHLTPAHLQSADGLRRIWSELGVTMQYYPITHSVFWLEHKLWGDATLGYHLVNIALHLGVAMLFWRFLWRLRIPGARWAALLFALHPIEVETVAWIAELKNTLSGVFALSAALCYLHFDETGKRRWYALALICFLLGLGSKSVIAVLPAVLLVIFWWQGKPIRSKRGLALAPFLIIGIAAGLFTAWVERRYIGAEGGEYSFSLIERFLIAGRAAGFYLYKLFLPADLVFIYPRWQISGQVWWQYLFPAALIATFAALWLLRNRSRAPIAGLTIFIILLFPALGFFNVYPFKYSFVADHFQYLAGMPIIALVTAGVWRLSARSPISPTSAGAGLCAILALVLAALTWRQSRIYENDETLYSAVIAGNPDCWLAHNNRGNARAARGDYELAFADFNQAIAAKPDYAMAYYNRGNAFKSIGRLDSAIADYSRAIDLDSSYADAYYNRALAKVAMQNAVAAIADYTRAIESSPRFAQAFINRGCAYEILTLHDAALADFAKAIEIDPNLAEAFFNRSTTHNNTSQFSQSIADCTRAIELRPDYAEAYHNRAMAHGALADYPRALADSNKAIELKPDLAVAYNNRAVTFMMLQDYDKAWADIRSMRRLGLTPAEPLVRRLAQLSGKSEPRWR